MVTRRTRNYKEKKSMSTFGQFILPLTVIMAVALLFFSVKLFFFNSSEPENIVFSEQKPASQESAQPKPEIKKTDQNISKPDEIKKVEIKQAQPVEIKKEEQQKSKQAGNVSVKTEPKLADDKKNTAKSEKTESAEGSSRWDVQIGAFSSKENALQLIEKVKTQGYTAYLTEDKKEGNSFYKVRVKNPEKGREEAVALSKKLEKDGYPFFLVEVK